MLRSRPGQSVDGQEILDLLAQLEITQWNYKEDNRDVTHIGPVAQDFYEAFGLGDNNKAISTIDPAGIALAAIKELDRKTRRIESLESELDEIKALLEQLLENDRR